MTIGPFDDSPAPPGTHDHQISEAPTAPDRWTPSSRSRNGHDRPGKVRLAGRWATGLLLAGLMTLGTAAAAQAAEIVVNTDVDPDGNTAQCTLREAIQSANTNTAIGGCVAGTGDDQIRFNIPGSGVRTITVQSALPAITQRLTIDGYTQPGARQNGQTTGSDAIILIELRGPGVNAPGLLLQNHDGSRIQGLAIRNFGQEGVRIVGGSQHFVGGNFIGTDASGTVDQGNGFDGIRIDDGSHTNVIGGALVQNRQVISGNGGHGVRINGPETHGNIVTNNYIGTNVSGTARIGNEESGVEISFGASNNIIGGTEVRARNVISSNAHGILMIFGATGNVVQGNVIGTASNGTGNLNNRGHGIGIQDSANNTIGGTADGAGNTIAFNVQDGISVENLTSQLTAGNRILRNTIRDNGQLPIDLVGGNEQDGVTANDDRDPDNGPNGLQNFPVIERANAGTAFGVGGILNSRPSTTYRLEFFDSGACNLAEHGDALTFLGATTVTTAANGRVEFVAGVQGVAPGRKISATATNEATGDTSEFSECKTVEQAGFVVTPISGPTTENGGTATFTVALATTPAADVAIDIAVSDASEAQVSPTTVTLPVSSAQSPRTVTVTGRDDGEADGDVSFSIILQPARSADPAYNQLNPPDVQAVNRDNEGSTPGPGPGPNPPSCPSRPPVRVQVSQVGSGALRATIAAQTNQGTPANALRELRFSTPANAVLDLPDGRKGVSGSVTLPLTNGTQQVEFTVRRSAPGAFTAPVIVVDGCGDWPTFVGGGPGVS